jgi:hypothetical protein
MFLAPALGASPVVTTNSAGNLVLTNYFGDVNDDGQVDVRDIVLLTHHLNGTRLLSTQMLARAEVNLDGAVSDTDRRILADMIAGRNTGPNDDFDGDELANAEEIRRGTNPFDPDTDHDGWLDGWEVTEGTDPLSAQSQPKLTAIAAPPVQVILPDSLVEAIADTNGVTVAYPAVQIILPDSLVEAIADTNGVTVAYPAVQIIFPDLPVEAEADPNGVTVARPPVTVINTNNPAQ